jgi:hypothetical protein
MSLIWLMATEWLAKISNRHLCCYNIITNLGGLKQYKFITYITGLVSKHVLTWRVGRLWEQGISLLFLAPRGSIPWLVIPSSIFKARCMASFLLSDLTFHPSVLSFWFWCSYLPLAKTLWLLGTTGPPPHLKIPKTITPAKFLLPCKEFYSVSRD